MEAPSSERLKNGIVFRWTWRISKKKKLIIECVGRSGGGSKIYSLAKLEMMK